MNIYGLLKCTIKCGVNAVIKRYVSKKYFVLIKQKHIITIIVQLNCTLDFMEMLVYGRIRKILCRLFTTSIH